MKNNIILIGASGAGKSTFGKQLSIKQGMNFIDFDDDVLEKINLETANIVLKILNLQHIEPITIVEETVSNILKILGSEKFLELEGYMSDNLELGENTILATSGSLPLVDSSMELLKTKGKIIYLKSKSDDIEGRINDMKLDRIVGIPSNIYELSKKEKLEKYEEIMKTRLENYEKYFDLKYEKPKDKTNKNGIVNLDDSKKFQKEINNMKFSFRKFYKFLKEQGIVKI